MLVATFGGRKLDQVVETNFPVFTIVLSVLGIALALYSVIKEVSKDK